MSILVRQFVAHQLVNSQETGLTLQCKADCFAVTPEIEELAHQLNHVFNQKPGKGVGGFAQTDDAEDKRFEDLLTGLANNTTSFIDFSRVASEKLKKALVDTGTLETGFIVFSHFEFLATEYLFIGLLNTRDHVEIDNSLELSKRQHLDLAKMQLAVKIDLTQYQVDKTQNRYISFIKGRMGRKISDFFMQFIGCEELVDIKQQNKQLLDSVDAYLATEQLDNTEKQQQRQQLADYYKEKVESGDNIQLAELAEQLPKSQAVGDFQQFNQQQESPLETEFQADKAAIKTLAKFSGQGGGISLSFDRALYGERVSYSAETDTLVIKGIPPNLKDQLLRNKS